MSSSEFLPYSNKFKFTSKSVVEHVTEKNIQKKKKKLNGSDIRFRLVQIWILLHVL